MKLIIQIPCYNEAATLPATLAELPRQVEGFDQVEWLVIDDGSRDDTVQIAARLGVDHVIRLSQNVGLAKAFATGIAESLCRGADVIVNTDADNQYYGQDVQKLVNPILTGEADVVIGARPIESIEDFSWSKKRLQRIGSWVVRVVSGTPVQDATSGFRAYNRVAAKRISVFSRYTYTLETIIQMGQEGFALRDVPVRVNPKTRDSRLVKSVPSYIKRSVFTMFRIFVTYRPMRFFGMIAVFMFTAGLALSLRFLIHYIGGQGSGMIQSLILAALLMGSSVLLFLVALLADLIAVNRRLLERLQVRLYEIEEKLSK